MNTFRLSHLLIALGSTVGIVVAGCSSSDASSGTGSTSLSSGLPPTQEVGSFSDADARKFCEALAEYMAQDPGLRATSCHTAGISAAVAKSFFGGSVSDADLQKTCSDAETACMNAPASTADSGASNCGKPTGTCTATVSELETCVTDSFAAFEGALAKLPSCATFKASDIGMAMPGTGTNQLPAPASCNAVQQKCPDALRSTGVPTAGAGGTAS